MLTRLEEFESMIKMVQQQTGNVIGITGTFSQIKDQENNLTQLCLAVDVLEGLVLKVKTTLDSLEDRVLQTEKQYEYLDNNTLKSFFKPIFLVSISFIINRKQFSDFSFSMCHLFQKKSPDVKVDASNIKLPTLDIQDIFKNTSDNN